MGRLFAVVSGKGGVGKSSFCVMLANTLKKSGSVLLIDLDTGLSCLDLMLLVDDKVLFNLDDLLKGERSLSDTAIFVEENLSLIAAPENIPKKDALRELLFKLSSEFDYVIVDFSAGSVDGGNSTAVDKVSLALNPDYHRALCSSGGPVYSLLSFAYGV